MALHPAVEWAQRTEKIFLTILVDDFKNPTIDCSDDKLIIKGVGGASKQNYECELEFFKPIASESIKKESSDRCLSFVLPKKESGPYWPRLLKSNTKYHWLKVDFDKWKDEDEQEEQDLDGPENDMGFGNTMGAGGGGMGGMGGMDFGNMMGAGGGMGGMDFSKMMGNMGGMGGMPPYDDDFDEHEGEGDADDNDLEKSGSDDDEMSGVKENGADKPHPSGEPTGDGATATSSKVQTTS